MNIALVYILFHMNILIVRCKLNGEGNVCGRPFGEGAVEEKIVGGYDVGYYKYTWYAALMVDKIVACGGTLIGSQTIVSAAHCFREYLTAHKTKNIRLEDVYNVTLGVYNRCEKEKSEKVFFVKKVYVHEKYKDNIPYYDISLLILKESTKSYQPICLPKGVIKNRPREGTSPGLGTLSYHGATPCTLHEARLLVYSDSDCRKMLNRTGNNPQKLYKAFCAGYIQGGTDTCQGDSGGPFQITDNYGNVILLGIVSFGFHCANPNLLGIYTDVSQYIDWIEEKSGFNATLGPGENGTQVTDFTTSSSASTHKTNFTTSSSASTHKTKKPHSSHEAHPGSRPINIIVINKNAEQKTLTKSKKKIYWMKKKKIKPDKHSNIDYSRTLV